MNGKIKLIKENVSMQDILVFYQIKVLHNGTCKCPFHQDVKPSMQIFPDNRFRCYGCGAKGDVIDFVTYAQRCSQKNAIDFIIVKFKLGDIDIQDENYKPLFKLEQLQKPPSEIHIKNPKVEKYLRVCANNVRETDYFVKRGLLPRTIDYFKLGYDNRENAIVIPYSNDLSYFQRRYVEGKKFYKLSRKVAGDEPIFNCHIFLTAQIIFVVESPICAMSIWQSGGQAVALCGAANYEKIIKCIKQTDFKGTLVLCLDNDEVGEQCTHLLALELDKINAKYVISNIAGKYKDPNELLIAKGFQLRLNVKNIINKIIGGRRNNEKTIIEKNARGTI